MPRRRGKIPKKPQLIYLSPVRDALLCCCRDPEEAAAVQSLGHFAHLLLDLVTSPGSTVQWVTSLPIGPPTPPSLKLSVVPRITPRLSTRGRRTGLLGK